MLPVYLDYARTLIVIRHTNVMVGSVFGIACIMLAKLFRFIDGGYHFVVRLQMYDIVARRGLSAYLKATFPLSIKV
jgi:hypothetical protein